MRQLPIVPQTDLHSHILPALDDGARDLDESLHMARRAAAAGIRRIVATPHLGARGGADPERLRHSADALQTALRRAEVDIEVVPGAETRLTPELVERLPSSPWLTIAGEQRYVLVMVEAPYRHWPTYVEQLLFRLATHQIIPIIGHPERLALVQRNPKALLELVERGARMQLTASSLTRRSPRACRRCAWELLRLGAVSFVASDAHDAREVLPGEVVGAVTTAVGEEEAYRILVENPRLVLAGRPVPKPCGEEPVRRPIRRLWFAH